MMESNTVWNIGEVLSTIQEEQPKIAYSRKSLINIDFVTGRINSWLFIRPLNRILSFAGHALDNIKDKMLTKEKVHIEIW